MQDQQKKQDDDLKKKADDEAKAIELAKSIVLAEDASLPKAEKVLKKMLFRWSFLFFFANCLFYRSRFVNPLKRDPSVSRSLVGFIVFVSKVRI